MKGDITRLTFRPEKHYQAVRMQQGRLQLDADWNEQVDIQNYLTQSLAKYVIGDSGVLKNSDSFRIDVSESASDFQINAGKMYVNGIICELEQNTTYKTQLDYPNPNSPELIQDKFYLAYIDVWERDITALEDPEIRESALKGLDTATRTKTIWQVKLMRVPDEDVQNNEITNWQFFANDLNIDRQVYLNAATANSVSKGELVKPKNGYLGSENQLYRVEIHQSGDIKSATFKWARNNGVTVSGIESIAGNTIDISNVGRDDLQSFKPNQWVEIIDEEQELKNEPGKLFRLIKVLNKQLDVVGDPIESQFSGKKNLKVIGWQEDQVTKEAEIKVSPNWIELEQGIYIQFDSESTYKTGDYWLIPARAYIKDIDWPYAAEPIKQRSLGIKHHYSPLALLKYNNGTFTLPRDYRPTFPSLVNCLDKTGDTMTGDLEIQANLYVTNGGKVGIGTKEPEATLHIDGNVCISNGTKSVNIAPQIDQWMQFTTNLDGYYFDKGIRIQNGVISDGQTANFLDITTENDKSHFKTNLNGYYFDKGIQIQSGVISSDVNLSLQTNGKTHLSILNLDGNVGIGIDDPDQKLQVDGVVRIGKTARFLDISAGEDNLSHFKTNLNGYYFDQGIQIQSGVISSDVNLSLQTNGKTHLSILNLDGNVGIGIDEPDQKLQVDGVVRIGKTASFLDISAGEDNLSHFQTNLNGYYFDQGIQIQSGVISSDANLSLQTNGKTHLSILNLDGNVGIGIDEPDQKLQVDGVVRIGKTASFLDISAGEDNLSHFQTNLNGYYFDKSIQIQSGVISSDTNLSLQTNGKTHLSILNLDGNVGIGIDEPDQKLQVDGVVRIGKTARFLDISAGEDNLSHFQTNLNGYYFDQGIQIQSGVISSDVNLSLQTNGKTHLSILNLDGNVGIGIDEPDQKLQVDGVVRIGKTASFLDISAGEDNLSHFQTNLNGYYFDQGIQIQSGVISSDVNLSLQTNGKTHLSILNLDGNVGIGIDEPDQKLQVDGVVRIGKTARFLDISAGEDNLSHFQTNLNGYYFDKSIQIQSGVISSDTNLSLQTNGKTQMLLTTKGNVSIGDSVSASDAKLYIDGNLRVNGRIFQDSSRELKENITELSSQEVTEILKTIKPIKFNYKNSVDKEIQAGFLSENVPSLLTSSDNTAISPVDIVAVLTKAVKDQQIQTSLLLIALRDQRIQIATLIEKVRVLESKNQ